MELAGGRGEWINLLTLSGGRTAELVSGATVPAGHYSELRFVICEAYGVTNDGAVFASSDARLPAGVAPFAGRLDIPSACASGVKAKFPSGDGAAVAVTVFSPVAVSGTDSVSTVVGTDGRYRITAGAGTYPWSTAPRCATPMATH